MKASIIEGADLFTEIVNNLSNQNVNDVTVGIHGDTDSEVVSYAIENEFGLNSHRERPFIRQTFDKNFQELADLGGVIAGKIRDGKITKPQGLMLWGEDLVNKINNEINQGTNFAPNSEPYKSSKDKKGQNPLQLTGRMQQSIKAVVE